MQCSQNVDVSFINNQGVNSEAQLDCEAAGKQDGGCSTSDITHHDSWSKRLRRVRSSTSGQGRRKRWRGRADDLNYACETQVDANRDTLSPAFDMDEDVVIGEHVSFIFKSLFCVTLNCSKSLIHNNFPVLGHSVRYWFV